MVAQDLLQVFGVQDVQDVAFSDLVAYLGAQKEAYLEMSRLLRASGDPKFDYPADIYAIVADDMRESEEIAQVLFGKYIEIMEDLQVIQALIAIR